MNEKCMNGFIVAELILRGLKVPSTVTWRVLLYFRQLWCTHTSISMVTLRLAIWRTLCLTNVFQSNPMSIDPGPCLSPWRYREPYTVVNEGCIQIWIQSKIYVRISIQTTHILKKLQCIQTQWARLKSFSYICTMLLYVTHTPIS